MNLQEELNNSLVTFSKLGIINVVTALVECGAEINVRGDWAIRYAAKYGHLDIIKYLISKGGNVLALDDISLNMAQHFGHSATADYIKDTQARINK